MNNLNMDFLHMATTIMVVLTTISAKIGAAFLKENF